MLGTGAKDFSTHVWVGYIHFFQNIKNSLMGEIPYRFCFQHKIMNDRVFLKKILVSFKESRMKMEKFFSIIINMIFWIAAFVPNISASMKQCNRKINMCFYGFRFIKKLKKGLNRLF